MKIKKGTTRIVFILNKVVIKIPNFTYKWSHFLRGIIGNISEWQTWKYAYRRRYLLCPVIWASWGGWFLIMKKANMIHNKDWDMYEPEILEHKQYYCGDDKSENYGIYMGQIVKIDYADLDENWGEDFKNKL